MDLDDENYNVSTKEVRADLNAWKVTRWSRIGRLNIAKMPVLPTVTCKFHAIPIKISANSLHMQMNLF